MTTPVQFDVIIIGGGPAGLAAALAARRANLTTLVIEKMIAGGQMNRIQTLANLPGMAPLSGSDLADQMLTQAQASGVQLLFAPMTAVDLVDKVVTTPKGIYQSQIIILATGAEPRRLAVANQETFANNGVHYCATCDGPLYRGQSVVVVGAGAAAVEDALFLAKLCRQVVLINPATAFDGAVCTALSQQPNLTVLNQQVVTALIGEQVLTGVMVRDNLTAKETTIPCQGVFVALGRTPNLDGITPALELDEQGYVLTDANCATAIVGVYAVGDVRSKSCRQVVTALADGVTAVNAAVKHLPVTANAIPLLDFFDDTPLLTPATMHTTKLTVPAAIKTAVCTFLSEHLDQAALAPILAQCQLLFYVYGRSGKVPVYQYREQCLLVLMTVGSPVAAGVVEELKHLGIENVIMFGTAGCLDTRLAPSTMVLIERAIRDEGTSYHYLPPALTVATDALLTAWVEQFLQAQKFLVQRGISWTTDGFFRETAQRKAKRQAQGAVVVEMECAGLAAACQRLGLRSAVFVFFSDTFNEQVWQGFGTPAQKDARRSLKVSLLQALLPKITEINLPKLQ